jgi:hypothetical protein
MSPQRKKGMACRAHSGSIRRRIHAGAPGQVLAPQRLVKAKALFIFPDHGLDAHLHIATELRLLQELIPPDPARTNGAERSSGSLPATQSAETRRIAL